jgi:hypothetical protein
MKVKKYRGKGKAMSGAAYKRMAWKQKMAKKFGGKSTGKTGKCFKCGQEGHWAKQCKGINLFSLN